MSKTDELFHAGHRERLKEKLQNGKITDYEKLELLLTYAIPRRDVRPLSRQLLARYDGVYNILRAPYEELITVPGVGRSTALLIKLFYELDLVSYRERAAESHYMYEEKFRTAYCRSLAKNKQIEEFYVLYLGDNMRLIHQEVHSRGTVNYAAVYPREILKTAIKVNALSVILVHNHPLSENDFSRDDVVLTCEIEQLLNTVGIELIDHFIVTKEDIVHSYRASPWYKKSAFYSK